MIMDKEIPTAQNILDALLLVTETNLERAEKDFFDACAKWESHRDKCSNMVTFHENVHDLLDDLSRIAMIGERVAMLKYFMKILNESKEMCQVE